MAMDITFVREEKGMSASKDKLTRQILMGLAAGAVATCGVTGTASATTLNEYKAQIAADKNYNTDAIVPPYGDDVIMDNLTGGIEPSIANKMADMQCFVAPIGKDRHLFLGASSSNTAVLAPAETIVTVTINDGTTLEGTYFAAGGAAYRKDTGNMFAGYGGEIFFAVDDNIDWIPNRRDPLKPLVLQDKTGTVDLTKSVIDIGEGQVNLINGTMLATAENIYSAGGEWLLGVNGDINIGDYVGREDVKMLVKEARGKAVLKLVGNTNFNTTTNASNLNGTTATDVSSYIRIDDRGVLEADSAQLFRNGLGTYGMVSNPNGLRKDASKAIYFDSGEVVLDDDYYNDTYLASAADAILKDDGGTTTLRMKEGAVKVEAAKDLSEVTNDGSFNPVTTTKTDLNMDFWGGDYTESKLSASSLDLAARSDANANTITISTKTMHLFNGTEGRELITVAGATPTKPIEIAVTDGGTLQLGYTNIAATNVINANVALSGKLVGNSTLQAAGGTQRLTSITGDKDAVISVDIGATLVPETLTLNGSTVKVNGTLTANDITSATDATVYIGTNLNAGTMTVSSTDAKLTGATIYMDPAWIITGNGDITAASKLAVADTTVDYNLVVGQNSVASLGTADTTAAEQAFADSELVWGESDITAALYLAAPVTLDSNYGITVDGTQVYGSYSAPTANTVTFAGQSLLMVDASALNGAAAITATNGTLSVADTAKLYLANATAGTTYTIVDGFDTSAASGWYTTDSNVIVNKLLNATVASGTVSVTTNNNTAIISSTVLPNILTAAVAGGFIGGSTTTGAVGYLNMATNALLTDAQSIALLNTGAQAAETVGATANTLAGVNLFADTAQKHLSLLSMPTDKDEHGIWAKYSYQKSDVDGIALGGINGRYDAKLNGITVGFDIGKLGNIDNGIAISYGKGSSTSKAVNLKDEYQVGGISYYAGTQNALGNTMLDIGYYRAEHELKGLIKADADVNAITIGATQEFSVPSGSTTIVPHVGLRYTYLQNNSYTGKYNGATAMRYQPGNKGMFTLPVGVGFMAKTESNGWKYNIAADLAYTLNLGGRTNDMTLSIPGLGVSDTFSYTVADRGAFLGTLGVEAESDTMRWGLSYSYKASANDRTHRVNAGISWKF